MKLSRRWLQKTTLLQCDAVQFGIQAHIGQTWRRHILCLLWNPGFITMFTNGCHCILFAPVDSANTLVLISLSSIWILSSCLCISLWSSLFPQFQLRFCISTLTCVLTSSSSSLIGATTLGGFWPALRFRSTIFYLYTSLSSFSLSSSLNPLVLGQAISVLVFLLVLMSMVPIQLLFLTAHTKTFDITFLCFWSQFYSGLHGCVLYHLPNFMS